MKQNLLFFTLSLFVVLTACKQENKTVEVEKKEISVTKEISRPAPANGLVGKMETAHKVADFYKNEMVSFDLELYFGGKLRLDGTILSATNSGKIKMLKKDGSSVLFDGEKIWLDSKDSTYKASRARFDIFTWQYFFALPYKLSDKGTKWELLGDKKLTDKNYPAGKMTFESGTGDAPDDWYVVYANEENLITGAGYIVTFGGTPAEKAVESAHAITYSNYEMTNNIPFATEWGFYNWSEAEGLKGEPIGSAKVKNIKFLTKEEADFSKPASATEVM
ncbi:MAG: hypothetical protein ACI85I_001582 [Arenicella sp.]|jgi:hypothetical protein